MTPKEQRIAIAEACGWEPYDRNGRLVLFGLPDYLNDLNAMHEAEKILLPPGGGKTTYSKHLADIVCGYGSKWGNREDLFFVAHATASQRAEAFLKTIGKWTED
jgi:hypothetical protein